MTVHVIGAGLAGLACAVEALDVGAQVVVYEMTQRAGGRCRSFYDAQLERHLDNGTHLIIEANNQTLHYINRLDRRSHFAVVTPAVFPFLDLKNGEYWSIRPNRGWLPWWILHPRRRVAGSRFSDYLLTYRLLWQRKKYGTTVANCLSGPLMRRLWQPLSEATLNTAPEEASAALFAKVMCSSIMRGERACRPYLARYGLGPALIEPALAHITTAGGIVRFGSRLRAVHTSSSGLRLYFDGVVVETEVNDCVVLALPPWSITALWPGFPVPTTFSAIINVHYRLWKPIKLPCGGPFLAVVGAVPQWLFIRGDVLSVTVSAANVLATQSSAAIAHRVWNDCAKVLALPLMPMPPARVIKEKRATPAHTPERDGYKVLQSSPLPGIVLAGDWTCSNLPATIEAAVTSGKRAAALALGFI